MKFNFHLGKIRTTAKDYANNDIILFFIVGILSGKFDIPEKNIWLLIDAIQKELLKRGIISGKVNDLIINTPKLLDYRVEREVDNAIKEYERWESSLPPRMTNKTILEGLKTTRFTDTQRLIVKDAIYYECPGGIMGIRGVWVDKDPRCD